MEIETREICLGEKKYTVKPLPFKRSKTWRRRLAGEVKPLFDQVAGLETAEFSKPSDLLTLWPVVETVLVDGIDAIFELLMGFADHLEQDRELIESTATDKQIMVAFMEVVAITDPFGLSRRIAQNGGLISTKATMTSSSLPSPNGASASSAPNSSPSSNPSA